MATSPRPDPAHSDTDPSPDPVTGPGDRSTPGEPALPNELGPQTHTPEVRSYGRAGRNLPVAIGVGVLLGAAVVVSLMFFHWGFVGFVALALVLSAVELHQALHRQGIRTAVVPICVGTVVIIFASYAAGQEPLITMPASTIMISTLALTVIAAMVWRMPRGPQGYIRDVAGSLFIIGYVPLLGSFVSLLIAGENGAARVVTFILVVVASDVGGYVAGVLFGRHPMAPVISPKKSWEGLVGSVVFAVAGAVAMSVLVLGVPWWTGVVLGLVLVGVGVCGDLIESLVKRDVGIKDMSSFLPGHGGVMDRIDSLLFSAPLAWLVMYLLVPGG